MAGGVGGQAAWAASSAAAAAVVVATSALAAVAAWFSGSPRELLPPRAAPSAARATAFWRSCRVQADGRRLDR